MFVFRWEAVLLRLLRNTLRVDGLQTSAVRGRLLGLIGGFSSIFSSSSVGLMYSTVSTTVEWHSEERSLSLTRRFPFLKCTFLRFFSPFMMILYRKHLCLTDESIQLTKNCSVIGVCVILVCNLISQCQQQVQQKALVSLYSSVCLAQFISNSTQLVHVAASLQWTVLYLDLFAPGLLLSNILTV